ncbi:60Kd inner membrane protein-domain-containing protein [Hyaloraphidium curvatum]|nr:60Kd inner membrane protein-domain-containing protein [Hyaloraphidium curvatum]
MASQVRAAMRPFARLARAAPPPALRHPAPFRALRPHAALFSAAPIASRRSFWSASSWTSWWGGEKAAGVQAAEKAAAASDTLTAAAATQPSVVAEAVVVTEAAADQASAAAHQASAAAADATSIAPSVGDAVTSIAPADSASVTAALADALPAAPPQIGDFSSIEGLHSWFSFAGPVERFLELLHAGLGLPWWLAIITATLTFRAAVFYFFMPRIQRAAATMANRAPLIRPLAERAALAKKTNNAQELALVQQAMMEQYKGASPFTMIGGIALQAPLFIGMFTGLRAMAAVPVPGFPTEGALWFPDLSAADPLGLLPVMSVISMVVVNELGGEIANPGMMKPGMKNFMRFMAVALYFGTRDFPAAFFLYFLANNLLTLVQMVLFKQPRVRAYFGIPKVVRYAVPGKHAVPGNRPASMADAWRLVGTVDAKMGGQAAK